MNNKIKILLILTLTFQSCGESNSTRTESLELEIQNLKIKTDSLTELLTEKQYESNYWFENKYDGKKLLEIGIKNPEEFIAQSLREKPELIPIEATLGGTMNFGKIQPLGNKWVIAEFDDGHIHSIGIYTHKLNDNGELDFELIQFIDPAE